MARYKIDLNEKILDYYQKRTSEGKTLFCLQGGRRSGKTFFCCQMLLGFCLNGDIVNVASMTQEQGRLGAYDDCQRILKMTPNLDRYKHYFTDEFEVRSTPREIRCRINDGKIFFNSYDNPETAKGIACDWLFVNEANNFTYQQITDLRANVRKGVFFDYNPMLKYEDWWISKLFAPDEICVTTWMDNAAFLTSSQLEYFELLKRLGDRPDANPVDRRNYLIYYCGQYSEISGKIFNRENLHSVHAADVPWSRLHNFIIFGDPSALRGADYFASVLCASDRETGEVYFIDAYSINTGDRCDIVRKYMQWGAKYQVERTYVETNGYVGQDFYDYAVNSGISVDGWYSKGNKFDRITANFQNLTNSAYFVSSPQMDAYLAQVFDFEQKCEHDDNIDAINSAYNAHKILGI